MSSAFTFSFLILMDLQCHIVFSPSWALYLARGSVLSLYFLVRLVASAALLSERTPVSLVRARLFWGSVRQSDVREAERFLSQLGRERREPSTSIPTLGAPVPWEGWNPMPAGTGNTHVQLT